MPRERPQKRQKDKKQTHTCAHTHTHTSNKVMFDKLMKKLWPETLRNLTLYFPRSKFSVAGDAPEPTFHK